MRILRRVWAETIWAPGAIAVWEGQAARDLKRVILPTLDLLLILMGVYAVRRGMPSFEIVWDAHLSSMAAWALLLSAVAAFLGIVFPKLWPLEASGKIVILSVLVGYSAALGWLDFIGEGDRGFVAFALASMALLPGWNLIRLGRERRLRKAEGRARKAANKGTVR